MPVQIKESDWKLLSQLRTEALERFCQRVLSEIEGISANKAMSAHQRYLEVYQAIQRHDEEIARIFNDHRRSTAFFELAAIWSHGLLTPEEFQRFSPEIRSVLSAACEKREAGCDDP